MALDPVATIATSLVLATVLALAGLHKLRAPLHYGAVVDGYRLLPRGAGTAAAGAIGAIELLAAVAILLPAAHAAGLYAAAALLLIYFGAITVNLARGRRDIDCGCGAPAARQQLGAGLLVRNAVLAATALWLAGSATVPRAIAWFDWAVALGAAAAGVLLYYSTDLLLANRRLLEELR